jgi:hypothetical protein
MEVPGWIIITFFAALAIIFILACMGIYYFASNGFNTISIVISAVIYVSAMFYVVVMGSWKISLFDRLFLFGLPFSFLSNFFETIPGTEQIFCLIGLALNYLAVFGIVNFINRLISKITL